MKQLLIFFIEIYQKTLSPDHSPFRKGIGKCRYFPSCSEYTKLSIKNHGSARGLLKGAYRVLRCNPFSAGGIDLSHQSEQILARSARAEDAHV